MHEVSGGDACSSGDPGVPAAGQLHAEEPAARFSPGTGQGRRWAGRHPGRRYPGSLPLSGEHARRSATSHTTRLAYRRS